MLESFRAYQLALVLYKKTKGQKLPYFLKDQLERAAGSVVLNLAEGSARTSKKERMRFYTIAFASLREVQAIIDMESSLSELGETANSLGGHLYKLISGYRGRANRYPIPAADSETETGDGGLLPAACFSNVLGLCQASVFCHHRNCKNDELKAYEANDNCGSTT